MVSPQRQDQSQFYVDLDLEETLYVEHFRRISNYVKQANEVRIHLAVEHLTAAYLVSVLGAFENFVEKLAHEGTLGLQPPAVKELDRLRADEDLLQIYGIVRAGSWEIWIAIALSQAGMNWQTIENFAAIATLIMFAAWLKQQISGQMGRRKIVVDYDTYRKLKDQGLVTDKSFNEQRLNQILSDYPSATNAAGGLREVIKRKSKRCIFRWDSLTIGETEEEEIRVR